MTPRTNAGNRRRNLALLVVGASLASAAGGVLIGRNLQSPAEAAASAAPPEPSRITVPVERRSLQSRLVANGELQYEEPTPVRLAGNVGVSAGSTQVITRAPELNAALAEGDVVMEVSGRPVFVFQGALPTYRGFEPGVTGPDVQQLEEALARLGFDPGPVDTVYDDATEAAIDALYMSKGYQSEGPSADQRTRLRAAEKAVADADTELDRANTELVNAGKPLSGAELLRQQQALQQARDAVPATEAAAVRRVTAANADVTAATTARDAALRARDAARVARDAAAAADAINPATGSPWTADERRPLEDDLTAKESALTEAENTLRRTIVDRDAAVVDTGAEVTRAKNELRLAEATFAEAVAPKDVTSARASVTAAQERLDQARADLELEQSQVGTKMPAGEMIFLPVLPTTITAVTAEAGKGPSDPAATVSSTNSQIRGRISASDADLVRVGTKVEIQLRDADVTTTGVVAKIEEPGGNNQRDDSGNQGGNQNDDEGRLVLVVTPDDPTLLRDFIGFSVRLTVTVQSTDGDVLAVPVGALSVGPDGESRVEIERSSGDAADAVVSVKVRIGLTADGYAEISPIEGATLAEGDRVVVGADTGRRGASETGETGESDAGGGGG
jgi:peptidoglycan hydrolase-like protein with peptidoglycan-binding domain/multidrug efflux pump subunit AcrA (membrane-fusion protein)